MKKFILLMLFILVSSAYSQPPNNLGGLKFCIDPGHGGNNPANDRRIEPDPGNVFWESESNFQKALLLRPLMQAKGATVLLTRETNNYPDDSQEPSLTARWQFANANNVNWFHSIHSNAGGGSYTMVLIKENISTRQAAFPQTIPMSGNIYTNIRANLRTSASSGNTGTAGVYLDYTFYGGPNGGYNLGVLSGLAMPGELSEGSFHDGFPEARRLLNNHYRKMEAYAILNGFLLYYGCPKDSGGIIAGIQTDGSKPVNSTIVRLLPENRVYNGDMFNNGFYMFDSLKPGQKTVRFETQGYVKDSVTVNVTIAGIHFADRTLTLNSAPFVNLSVPAKNDTNVLYTSSVKIYFSHVMDTATVRNAFSITPAVNGTLVWSDGNKTLTFTPKPYFAYSTIYQITIGATAKNMLGFFMDGNADGTGGDAYTLIFKTERAIPPRVVSTTPAKNDTNIVNTSTIVINFSRKMDTASVRSAFSITPFIAGALEWTNGNTTLTFRPSRYLYHSTVFTITIDSTAKSDTQLPIDGNGDEKGGDAYILTFKVQRPIPPYVMATTPKQNDTAFSTTGQIGFKFSKPMDTTSIKAAFSITPAVAGTFSFNVDKTIFYYKPTVAMLYSTPYQVTISDIAISFDSVQVDGNQDSIPGGSYILNFKTKSAPLFVRYEESAPTNFALEQNYPNPFNPTTTISFAVSAQSYVSLKVFDVLGREVASLIDENLSAGKYSVQWNASTQSSGIYFYKLTTENYSSIKRMMLVK